MGAILGAYRARKKNFELRELRNLVAPLSWKHMLLKNFDGHRFGIPAAYRLYLREVIGHEFESNGAFMRIKDLAIPFRACWAGLSEFQLDPADANLLHETDNRKLNITKAVADYAKRPVKAIYIGANETTKEFDVLDTVAFSSAVPGLIHYDIVRDDPRMISLVEELLKKQGVLRVIDGGLADNLPSEQAYLAVQENSDTLEKDPIVLALDSFSPNYRKHLMFLPLMKMAEKTSQRGRAAADMNLAFKKIISPLSIVPTPEELMQAVEWGQEEIKPHMRCLRKLIGPIPEPEGLV